jgi:hypothetical protein
MMALKSAASSGTRPGILRRIAEVRFRARRVPGSWREEARRADGLRTWGEIRNL